MKRRGTKADDMKRYVVFDDLALSLQVYPIIVPLPSDIRLTEESLKRFVMSTLKDLMKLKQLEWYHSYRDVVYNGFQLRHDKIYPDFST